MLIRAVAAGKALRRAGYLITVVLCLSLLLPGLLGPAPRAHAAAPRALPAQAFSNGSLIRDAGTGKVYLIWADRRHWIDSLATLSELGLAGTDITTYDPAQIAELPEGTGLHLHTVANGLLWPLAPIQSDVVKVSVERPGVAPGGVLRLDASGFLPGEPIIIQVPVSGTFSLNADAHGGFTASIIIPGNTSLGLHQIYVQGNASGLFGAQVFHVIPAAPAPTAAVFPTTVPRGGALTISGSGFVPGEQVLLFLRGGASVGTTNAGDNGTFGPLALPVPATLSGGSASVLIYGASSARATTATVTVVGVPAQPTPFPTAPSASVSPALTSPGGRVVISGAGFLPGELVLVRFNGTLETGIQANAFGSFSGVLLNVPAGTGTGVYSISLTGATSGRTALTSLTVQTPQPVPVASIAISPSSAQPGAGILVAGTGFAPGETVLISFNGVIVQNLTADAGGSFVNGHFVVPGNAVPGRYTVTAAGATSGRSASTWLVISSPPQVVVARISVNPSAITPGGRVSVQGSGFAAGEPVVLRIDNVVLLGLNADASGTFSTSFSITIGYGNHTITAVGASSGRSASAGLAVVHPIVVGIGLVPNRGHRGSTIRVNGNNFIPGEEVVIRFRDQLVQAVRADAGGRFANVPFVIPGNAPYGVSYVTISGARSGRSARSALLVQPTTQAGPHLSLSSTNLHRGSRVTVSGGGFLGGEVVLIRFRGALVQAAQADGHGNFSRATFQIPFNSPYGSFPVSATGARSGRSKTITVHVSPTPVGTGISVSPTVVKHNGSVSVSGHGFAGGEIVLIRLNGTLVAAPTADRHGNFGRVTFRIPSGTHKGIGVVQAVGARSGHHAQVSIAIV